jgi:hypothetical protein
VRQLQNLYRFAGPGSFYGGIQGKQVGLLRYFGYCLWYFAYLGGSYPEFVTRLDVLSD